MVYTGKVQNGVVILDNGADLADGTMVRVDPLPRRASADETENIPTLYEQLQPFIGRVEGLPPDMAAQHDHYLHGRLEGVSARSDGGRRQR